jgi:hypothetical protein
VPHRQAAAAEFEQFTRTGGTRRIITAGDFVDLADGLNYAGRPINELQLQAWINQFGDDPRDRHWAFVLLRRLVKEGYFSSAKIYRSMLPKLRDEIRSAVPELRLGKQGYVTNIIIANHGHAGSSAPVVVSSLHQSLRVKKENCLPIEDVPRKLAGIANPVVIIADDFAGTGNQLAKSVDELCMQLDQWGDWRESTVLVVGAAIVADTSLWTSERFGGVDLRVAVGQLVSDRLRAFADGAGIFDSEDDRVRARDLVTVIGKSLQQGKPLGWAEQGLLVLLEANCPNNTLPVFWKEGRYGGRPWKPLFPRAT